MMSIMNTRQKIEIIQKALGVTQTKLALRFGVSFATLNSWLNERSTPRQKKQFAIDELLLEVTGQKVIPADQLFAKKRIIENKSRGHESLITEILNNPDIRDRFILKLTYHSNSIEGSTLTEPDTAAILFDNVALPDKSLVEQMEAKNHQAALTYLLSHIAQKGSIDENLTRKLHGMLMNGIRPDAGLYRNHAVRIMGVHLPTANHIRVPSLIQDVMQDAAKKTDDTIALSASVHSRFEQIHPFSDGNGRVGRLLMTAMLLKANIAPAIIHQQQKRLYYTYLYKAQIKEDQSQLEDFLCEAVIDGFKIIERADVT